MKIQPYITRQNNSTEYKDFHKKNNDAFMAAGFFVIDYESGKNIHQIDYYLPSKKKIAAFTLDHGVTLQILDTINYKTPEKLDMNTNIDLDALQGILKDEMKNRSITEDIKKIIAILQKLDGKLIWNLNCVLSGMGILRAHVEDETKTILKMEKVSILDYMKKVSLPNIKHPEGAETSADPKEKLKKLKELEAAIEKEKEKYEEEIKKSPVNKKTDKKSKK